MIDLHCHLLPAVDDGALSLEMAVTMARALAARGYQTIAASPHMGTGPGGDVALEVAAAARALLAAELRRLDVVLELVPNGEHWLSTELFDRLAAGTAVPIGGAGRWLLVEVPWTGIPNLEDVIFRLQTKGWRLLLAHPERLESLSLELLLRLSARGVRMQLELGSFVGMFGGDAEHKAELLMRKGVAHVLATDMHRPDKASEWLAAALTAVQRRFGLEALRRGTADNPRLILDNGGAEAVAPLVEVA
ncbi:MAG: protein tyrosine phosphatase [Deltaproteobacteria bacterium]|nr:protein tyrosine phosphatase [Deltaproteobacteria bacterium]